MSKFLRTRSLALDLTPKMTVSSPSDTAWRAGVKAKIAGFHQLRDEDCRVRMPRSALLRRKWVNKEEG